MFFGNLHAHTSFSDGSGTPDEAFAAARAAGLQFLAITEHNHPRGDGSGPRRDGLVIARSPHLYAGTSGSLVESANRHDRPGTFVTLFGQELSTIDSGNHINIFGIGEVVDVGVVPNGDGQALINWVSTRRDLAGKAPLLQFNHPRDPARNPLDYGRDDFADADWVRTFDPFVELIEVLNAPALEDGRGFRAEAKEGYYLEYLNLGFHVGPSVGHDNHWRNWGVSTDARIGVVATSLSRTAIMDALRARRTTASDDRNLRVVFRSGEAIGGDIAAAPAPGALLPLSVEIHDPDELGARYRVDVLIDRPGGDRARRPAETFVVNGNTAGRLALEGVRADAPGFFVLLRVTQSSIGPGDTEHQESEDRLWTAPIWFETAAAPVAPAPLRIASLLPNPAGDEFQNERVSIRSTSGATVDLSGWQLRDASGNVWPLGGLVQPDQTVPVTRLGRAMSLNNDGDTVELVEPGGTVVHSIAYGRTAEGVVLEAEP